MGATWNRLTRAFAPLLVALAWIPAAARADWPSHGKMVFQADQAPSYEYAEAITAANGDLFVVLHWGPSNCFVKVRRIDAAGTVWGPDRILHPATFDYGFRPGVVPTGDGSLLHIGYARSAYSETYRDVILQRLAPDGSEPAYPAPLSGYAWQLQHLTSTGSPEASVDATSDGGEGAYVRWSVKGRMRLQRRLNDGSLAAPWPATGMNLGLASWTGCPGPRLMPDGTGGVVLLWTDGLGAHVDRILADTTRAPGWPSGGKLLGGGAAYSDQFRLIPSGTGHFIAVWRNSAASSLMAQRFDLDGITDPEWPVGGRELIPAAAGMDSFPDHLRVLSDGNGGVHVVWTDEGLPRWSRWRSDGSLALGHSQAGRVLLDPGAQYSKPWSDPHPLMAVAAPNGGLIFAWNDLRLGGTGRARWFLGDSSNDPAEPDTGRVLPSRVLAFRSPSPRVIDAVHYRSNIATFLDYGVAVMRVIPSDLLDVPASRATALQLALSGAHPARGSVTLRCSLPTDSPAELSLHDLAGRRVRSLPLQGAGTRTAIFDDLASLAPGLYLASLASEGERRTVRVVVVR